MHQMDTIDDQTTNNNNRDGGSTTGDGPPSQESSSSSNNGDGGARRDGGGGSLNMSPANEDDRAAAVPPSSSSKKQQQNDGGAGSKSGGGSNIKKHAAAAATTTTALASTVVSSSSQQQQATEAETATLLRSLDSNVDMPTNNFAGSFARRIRGQSIANARARGDTIVGNSSFEAGAEQNLLKGSSGAAGGGGSSAASSLYIGSEPPPPPPRTKHLHTHHYSEAELKKMGGYESVDTWEAVTDLYLEHIDEKKTEHRYMAWLIYCVVGFCIGFWAILVFHSIDQLSDIKMLAIAKMVHDRSVGEAFAAHVGWSIASGLLATLMCVILPTASGGGVPEVMAQLNGISMPEQVKAKVVGMKSLSVIFAVHSGMPVGAEGPMIQFGSIIGGLVSAGRSGSSTLNEWLRPFYRTFQNPKDQRDFVTAGAAAGVTSVFASPIGGFLFVMEEIASFMNPKVAWMTFSSCLCCYLFVQVGGTYLEGWKPREVDTDPFTDAFLMNPDAVTLFNQNLDPRQFIPVTLLSLLPAAAVAIGMGLWAAGFIHLHCDGILQKWRWKHINTSIYRKVAEPVIVSLVFACIFFGLSIVMPCQRIPFGFKAEQIVNGGDEDIGESSSSSPSSSSSESFYEYYSRRSASATTGYGSRWSGMFKTHASPFLKHPSSPHPLFGQFGWSNSNTNNNNNNNNDQRRSASAQMEATTSNNNTNNTAAPDETKSKAFYGGLRLHTAFCKENVRGQKPTHYSSFASLSLAGAYNTIRLCLSRHTMELIDVGSLALYFFIYSFGACYCSGMFMASGIVIPTLIIGSVGGRLIGCRVVQPWSDPGVMALMGAASFFAGLSRLTVSLVVIMVEISDDLNNVAVMMVCVIISKFVADALSHSLYHEQLQMRGVPFLDFDTQIHNLDKHCVADIMTPDPLCLPIVVPVSSLYTAAKSKFSGFPVVRRGVNKEEAKKLKGFLKRSEVLTRPVEGVAAAAAVAKSSPSPNNKKDDDTKNQQQQHQQNLPSSPTASGRLGKGTHKAAHIDASSDFTFLGTITREMCARLLWHLYVSETNSATAEPPLPSYYDLLDIDDFYTEQVANKAVGVKAGGGVDGSEYWLPPETTTFRDRYIDLSPFINSSAFFVPAEMAISRAYNLFRSMSMRHLAVVDAANQLIGVIGRKNLLGHYLNENVERKEEALINETKAQS